MLIRDIMIVGIKFIIKNYLLQASPSKKILYRSARTIDIFVCLKKQSQLQALRLLKINIRNSRKC